MKVIEPRVNVYLDKSGMEMLRNIEDAGRTCYKSEGHITDGSAVKFIKMILKRGHLSVIEHEKATARIVCDRGITHEIVRHRLASYSQESTRYCNYNGQDIQFIKPNDIVKGTVAYDKWLDSIKKAEEAYQQMIELGCSPQTARSVLPNSLKTEIVMTANLREWRHFFELRCDAAAHPDMRVIAKMLLIKMYQWVPVIFDDIYNEVFNKPKE